ncbi:MAG TPA: VWA domain-containing protein, partial [Quisquiliibacterium sp.]|nr:VWA domain-containing protein [Quisquiliibacterium sp.]
MDVALARYIRALRAAGAEISTAEAIDAARAVAIVGYSERTTLKDTLSVVLAKSEDEKAVHDRLFDLYFSRTEAQARADGKTGDASTQDGASGQQDAGQPGQQDGQGQNAGENAPGDPQGAQPRGDEAAGDPSQQPGGQQASGAAGAPGAPSSGGGSGQGGGASSSSPMPDSVDALVALANSGDADRLGRTIARAAEAAGVDDIRFESQTAYYVRRTLVHMGIEALEERMLGRMRERTDAARAEVQRLMDARSSLQRQVRAHVAKRFELFGRGATDQFMNEVMVDRSIGQLGARDIERLKAVVARMAKRLAVRHSRRRRIHERGRLDLRRTLRANAGYGGTLVELVWKTRRKDRPKIVAV